MNKMELLRILRKASRGNIFSIEIPKVTHEDGRKMEQWADGLQREGKIKLRECVQRDYSVYLHGIMKYAPK
ncbi:hypothetical protein QUF84_17730 [Fictibacillus enclensis]|uniref:hypothetical protein n=1 Tax=Fictibacillus enclensis TaxID=1017270 RepID=UPI0024BF81D6|nr:hypothetical protein [Fictibacillus enclensis]MDM5339051.1 hypothetical protein [Fictibacillus enclensis]WHY70550.1 hypothetical protein QNH15_15950 [Fictibacillus enclensis]